MRFGNDDGRSSNIEDRRGLSGRAGLGIGGTAVVLILSLVFGRNLFDDIGVSPSISSTRTGSAMTPADSAAEEPQVRFVGNVLDDAQASWAKTLPAYGAPYHNATLVLFRDMTETGCGAGQAAMGPFYCPLDEKVYVDLSFYDELRTKFGAKGDFAQAYVLAHELGHHVQHILGTDAKVRQAQQSNPGTENQLSVRLELQADCYAGVWGKSAQQRGLLDPGDMEEGLNAAAAVGDDRILSRAGRNVNVESFTHGSAEQRASWFRKGFDSGDPRACDTFAN